MSFKDSFNNICIEKMFVIFGLLFGLLFIYIIPPFESPDEDSHFKKAYSISNFEFYRIKEKGNVGFHIPNDMIKYINEKNSKMSDLDFKYSYKDLYFDQLLPSNLGDTSVVDFSTSSVTPIAHVVPGLGILTSKIFAPMFVKGDPSTSYMLNFARLFSLSLYLVLGYFAIKNTPVFKKSMFTIMLLPMSLFLGSMVTYDSLLLGVVLLSVSIIFKLIYEKKYKFEKKHLVLFSILGYILLNIKVVYFPILFLLLLVPKEKFNEKNKWKLYLLLVGIIVLATVVLKIPNYINSVPGSEYSGKQLSYIIGHPFDYINTLINNISNQFNIEIYWMLGTFGLLDTYLPPMFAVILLINMIIVFITDGITDKIKINDRVKLICFMFFVFAIVAIYSALYISWTPGITGVIGGNEITGVQGRYFIPLLIVIPIIFSTDEFSSDGKIYKVLNNYFSKSIIITVSLLIVSMIVCLTRFWI